MELGLRLGLDREGRTIWIVDAHRDDGKRFIMRADEMLTAFLELERAICVCRWPQNREHAGLNLSQPGLIMKLESAPGRIVVWGIRKIIHFINAYGLITNVATISPFVPPVGELARILITVESQGEYTEEQKKCARRRIRK